MADIKNKNELKRRIELFLDELDYSINEKFCKETMKMMREFIGHTSHQLDCKNSKIDSLNKKLREYQRLEKEGLLLRLPIAIGSEFWELNYACKEPYIYPRIAHQLHHCVYVMEHLGKTAFLTKEEAEQKCEFLRRWLMN